MSAIALSSLTTITSKGFTINAANVRAAIADNPRGYLATVTNATRTADIRNHALFVLAAPGVYGLIRDGMAMRAAAAEFYPTNKSAKDYAAHLEAAGALIVKHGVAADHPLVIEYCSTTWATAGTAMRASRNYAVKTAADKFSIGEFERLFVEGKNAKAAAKAAAKGKGKADADTTGEGTGEGVAEPEDSAIVTLDVLLAMVANIPSIARANGLPLDVVAASLQAAADSLTVALIADAA